MGLCVGTDRHNGLIKEFPYFKTGLQAYTYVAIKKKANETRARKIDINSVTELDRFQANQQKENFL